MFQIRDTRFANNTRYCREEDGGGGDAFTIKIFDRQKIMFNIWLLCTLALFLGLNHIRPENEAINTWVHMVSILGSRQWKDLLQHKEEFQAE